jgi:hypothetical protein
MEALLFTLAVLLGLALVQALVGIFFFRPFSAVWNFFFQCLILFSSTVLVLGFTFEQRFTLGWLFVGLFVLFFALGFRSWKGRSEDKVGLNHGEVTK